MDAKNFAKEYYQLEKSNVEIVSVESAITFAEKYHALQLQQTDVMRLLPIDDILMLDRPYSLKHVIDKLVEASEILLHNKNYDGHGWELISHCVDLGKEISSKFEKQ